MSHRNYAQDLVQRFNMQSCKKVLTPLNPGEKLQVDDNTKEADARKFRNMVGGLIYMSDTSLYIGFFTGVVSIFMNSTSKHHLGAVKRMLCHVAGLVDYAILYEHVENFKLSSYTDNDWEWSLEDSRHTSGLVFSLGSGAIAWSLKK